MRVAAMCTVSVLSLTALAGDAAAQQSGSTVCARPWAIADRWIDNHDETEPIDQIWTPDDTFERLDAQGNLLPDADVYLPPSSPGSVGFSLEDIGMAVFLKIGDASAAAKPGSPFAVDIGNAGGGGAAYRTAIAFCDPAAPTTVMFGESLTLLKGNLHGPTIQGATDLIGLDPTAYWDVANRTINESCAENPTPCAPFSPRLGVVAAYDPDAFEQSLAQSGSPQLRVSNVVGVFIEGYYDGYVIGRLVPVPVVQP
jgi:hypothetical protein